MGTVAKKGAAKGSLRFKPTAKDREYFDQLGRRLTMDLELSGHATQREIFGHMVVLAQLGEAASASRNGGPQPTPNLPKKTRPARAA